MSEILKLNECGQSYWLDNLSRKKINSGELRRRVSEEGLTGITSNPAIFNQAIVKSHDYDNQINNLKKTTSNPIEIYETLAIKDIQDACDILRPIYDRSNKVDGYVSFEVSPHLARDTESTKDDCIRLFEKVGRPNCLIKIPGTLEGLPAIEEMLYRGININITLLFSVKVYEEVAHAYIRALTRRADENLPIGHIGSVASFFLSRIDTLVDQLLMQRISDSNPERSSKAQWLLGKVAVANAVMAYQSYKRIFSGTNWEKLKSKGAHVQRPLWASTSTKNPDYSDVMYVEPLIGVNTVNTMPDATVEAVIDHGRITPNTIEQNVDEAKRVLSTLSALGIDLDVVTEQLVNEGIQKFIEPFDALIESIEGKVTAQR